MAGSKRKKVSMADIASKFGVSRNAVSLALSGKAGVSDELRSAIRSAAAELGYLPAENREQNRQAIAVLVPSYIRDDGSFYSDVFWAIEHESRALGILTITCGLSKTDEAGHILPQIPDELRVIGFLAVGIISVSYLEMLRASGANVVSVDIRPPLAIPSVSADNVNVGRMAAEYLIDHGHREIGFIGPVFCAQSVYERFCGYRQALLNANIPYNEDICVLGNRTDFELLDNSAILKRYIDRLEHLPGAVFCAGDMIAVSLYMLLHEKNIRVPGDISIIGCDDLKIGQYINPPLTSVHIDRKLIGKQAVKLLLNSHGQDAGTPVHIMLPCSLAERSSVEDKASPY